MHEPFGRRHHRARDDPAPPSAQGWPHGRSGDANQLCEVVDDQLGPVLTANDAVVLAGELE